MDVANFTTPLNAIQILSVFSYLGNLSNFLYNENRLSAEDQYKQIPIVNSLFHYILDPEKLHYITINRDVKNDSIKLVTEDNQDDDIEWRKMYLARKLINGTDLYGGRENEKLDIEFVNNLYEYLVNSLVFDKYTNIYGFIAEVVRTTSDLSFENVKQKLKISLENLNSENEDDTVSNIDPLVFDCISSYISTIFPSPPKDMNILSVEYIYAQTGSMFLRLSQNKSIFSRSDDELKNKSDYEQQFEEYMTVGHLFEQAIAAKQLDMSAIKIFALPALLFYISKEKESLRHNSTAEIISDRNNWMKAYRLLFSHLNEDFDKKERELKFQESKYNLVSEWTNIKHRNQFAREIIENNCTSIHNNIEQEITSYENNPDSYACKSGNVTVKQPDLNLMFKTQNDKIQKLYSIYVKQAIVRAFGDEFIESLKKVKVEIRGEYVASVGSKENPATATEFFFYFPDKQKYNFGALIEKQFNMTFVTENDYTELFNRKEGILENRVRVVMTSSIKKHTYESFDIFIAKVAQDMTNNVREYLDNNYYDQTRREWWKNFGLNLIPFRSCINDVQNREVKSAIVSCGADTLILFTFLEEGYLFRNLARSFVESAFKSAAVGVRSFAIKLSFREVLAIGNKIVIEETEMLSKVLTKEAFQDLGIAAFRAIDPGFQLLFAIGRGGVASLRNLMVLIRSKLPISFKNLEQSLKIGEKVLNNGPLKVKDIYEHDVLVQSYNGEHSGFGFKYINLQDGRVAEERDSMLVVVDRIEGTNTKVYKEIDITSGRASDSEYISRDGKMQYFDKNAHSEFQIIEDKVENICEDKVTELYPGLFSYSMMKCPRFEVLDIAAKTVQEYLKEKKLPQLTEDQIKSTLITYSFPNLAVEQLFYERYSTGKLPIWAKKYEVMDPTLIRALRYEPVIEKKKPTDLKIKLIYSPYELQVINEDLDMQKIRKDYIKSKAYNHATFEDYFALRNYNARGFQRIGKNTVEARMMKNALYRLAIRQFDDPPEKYATKLFATLPVSAHYFVEKFRKGSTVFKLQRFLDASKKEISEAYYDKDLLLHFEIEFPEKNYFRADLSAALADAKETVVLFPGSEFEIVDMGNPYTSVIVPVQLKFRDKVKTANQWLLEATTKIKKNQNSFENF